MSAELFRRATDDAEGKLIRKWIMDLENVIEERDARIHDLEAEILALKARLRSMEAIPQDSYYTPVNAPLEFTETPGTYVPFSKPSEAERRVREALLRIDAATIKDWEETEQALRRAALGLLPGEVDDSNTK
jgi:hypothetical protein